MPQVSELKCHRGTILRCVHITVGGLLSLSHNAQDRRPVRGDWVGSTMSRVMLQGASGAPGRGLADGLKPGRETARSQVAPASFALFSADPDHRFQCEGTLVRFRPQFMWKVKGKNPRTAFGPCITAGGTCSHTGTHPPLS